MSASVQPDEVQLLTALSAGMGAHRTGVQILADGRKKVVVQGIVHVILTVVRSCQAARQRRRLHIRDVLACLLGVRLLYVHAICQVRQPRLRRRC